jgi:hypothetical protein
MVIKKYFMLEFILHSSIVPFSFVCYAVAMTIQQTIEIPAGLHRLDVPLQKEYPFGRASDGLYISPEKSDAEAELELLMPQEKPLTEAEAAAHTQYILRELAKTEKKIADGKAVWLSDEEFWADLEDDL